MPPRSSDFKYMDIYHHFKSLIEREELRAEAKLPTEEQIARMFSVSRITVVRGLERLQQDRYIYRVQGSGSYVRSKLASEDGIKVVSLITSFKGSGREGQLISGLESGFKESGYMLSVSNSHEKADVERELILSIKDKIQGIVLYASNSVNNIDLFESLLLDNYPIVFIDRYPLNLPCGSVSCDNFDGGYQIGKFFVEHGHQSIGFIYHNLTGLSSERDRYNGFMHALSEGNVPRNNISTLSIKTEDTPDEVEHAITNLFRVPETAPTAVFAVNDHLAMVVQECIRNHPEYDPMSILIAGFDDLNGRTYDTPFITIRQEYTAIGKKGAEMLLDKIENQSYRTEQHVVPIRLVKYNV